MANKLPAYQGNLQVLKIVQTNETFVQLENLVAGMEIDNAPGSFDPDATPEVSEARATASAASFVKAFSS